MKIWLLVCLLVSSVPLHADTVVATRTIRANAIIQAGDVKVADVALESGFSHAQDVVGQEARVALYAGRPIMIDQIGPPALVTRNQIVRLQYASSSLRIVTEGRALERGAIGDRIRVMNLGSRATVFGQILEDGSIRVRK